MTTNNARYHTMTAARIIEAVQQGEGDSIGLPSVPLELLEDAVDATRAYIVMEKDWEADEFMSELIDTHVRCSECDTVPDSLTAEDRAIHIMAGAYVVVGCEGFHTALLRVIYANI